MNIFRRKQETKPEPPKPSKEEELLTEIRDLLAAQQAAAAVQVKTEEKSEKEPAVLTK